MQGSILDIGATRLAELIQSGQVSSSVATETYIEHLQRANPKLNCLVEDRFAEARREAQRCDELRAQGDVSGRLFGVPISMKEAFDVAGMKTTGGLVHRREHLASADAEVVARLKREGAIILGKTNTPTLCYCQESDNKLYGRSNNPWDLTRTTGGSSGGEAALIAIGGAAVGVGSDIGGSIRFPAHFNGVVGFRSGNRQVSQVGHFPFTEDPWQERMLGMGAISKSVDDAELINEIIAEVTPQQVDVEQFQVIVPPPDPRYPMGAETAQLLTDIRNLFSQTQSVTDAPPPFFEKMALWWQLIMSVDGGASIAQTAFEGKTSRVLTEYVKEVTRGSSLYHRYLTWALIGAKLFQPSRKVWSGLLGDLQRADEQVAAYLQDRVLVIPVYHRGALTHGGVYKEIFSIRKTYQRYMPYVAMVNVLGLPALTVPVGTDEAGMPVAVQVVGSVGNERALFHVGRMVEENFRGYVRCAAYDKDK